jgi:hypothetical protein
VLAPSRRQQRLETGAIDKGRHALKLHEQ